MAKLFIRIADLGPYSKTIEYVYPVYPMKGSRLHMSVSLLQPLTLLGSLEVNSGIEVVQSCLKRMMLPAFPTIPFT